MSLWPFRGAKRSQKNSNDRVGVCWEPEQVTLVAASTANTVDGPAIKRSFTAEQLAVKGSFQVALDIHRMGLRGAKATGVLPFSEYQSYLVDLPNVPADEMRDAIQWKIKDQLSLPLSDYVIDFIPLPYSFSTLGAHGQPPCYAVAAKKTSVQSLVNAANHMGLALEAIDVADMSVCHLIARLLSATSSMVAVVVLTETEKKLLILGNGLLLMARSLSGGNTVSFGSGRPEWGAAEMSGLVDELERSIDYFESQVKQGKPENIIFVSDFDVTESMLETVERATRIPATHLSTDALFVPDVPASLGGATAESEYAGLPKASGMASWLALGAAFREVEEL